MLLEKKQSEMQSAASQDLVIHTPLIKRIGDRVGQIVDNLPQQLERLDHTIAIIDLGTNTFHLLIAQISDKGLRTVGKWQKPVGLGHGGINHGIITDDAMERGWQALQEYDEICRKYKVDDRLAYGTSALRSAGNSYAFLEKADILLGAEIMVIAGDVEAELIYKGVKGAIDLGEQQALIMDIGGGSVEFIIANAHQVFWMKSYEIGGARLAQLFKKSDPISADSINELCDYLEEELSELADACKLYRPDILVGAAGSFETLAMMEYAQEGRDFPSQATAAEISPDHFVQSYESLTTLTANELKDLPGMKEYRIGMISVTAVLIKEVLLLSKVEQMAYSAYSLKEGVVFGYQEDLNA